LGLVVAIVCLLSGNASAVDEDPDAESRPLSAPTVIDDAPPIDASKHGTVEAEIPATSESTAAPPTRDYLAERLMGKRWDRGGYFIGAFGHYAIEVGDRVGSKTEFASGGGASIRVGMKHDRFWSTEVSGFWTSKFKRDGDEYGGWGVSLGERFYFSRRRFQPYIGAHVGLVQLHGEAFDHNKTFGFSPKFNTGVDFFITETLNVELDITYYYMVRAVKGADFVTVGLGMNWF